MNMHPQFPPVNPSSPVGYMPPSPVGYMPSAAPPLPGYGTGTQHPTTHTQGFAVSSVVLGLIPLVTVGLIVLLLLSPLSAWVSSQALLFVAVVPLVYFVTASLAVMFGYAALDRIKRQPFAPRIRGAARFGVALGAVGLAIPTLGVCAYFVYIFNELGNVG